MNRISDHQPLHTDLAALTLRLILGGLFTWNGYEKLIAFNEILPIFGDIIGIGSRLSLILVIFAELVCGFLVTIGLLTRLTVIPIFITMTVAFFIAHANDQFAMKQLPFVYWLLCITVFILGSGKYSLDRLIFKRRRSG